MSERSTYLRDQAAKCLRHAMALSDVQTQAELRKLAAEYAERAADIESKEPSYGARMQGRLSVELLSIQPLERLSHPVRYVGWATRIWAKA